MRRKAFTLVELLVVVSIIVLLVAILLPSLGRARKAALQVRCLSNLRQIAIGSVCYQQDNRRLLPTIGYTIASGRQPHHMQASSKPNGLIERFMRPYFKATPNQMFQCPGELGVARNWRTNVNYDLDNNPPNITRFSTYMYFYQPLYETESPSRLLNGALPAGLARREGFVFLWADLTNFNDNMDRYLGHDRGDSFEPFTGMNTARSDGSGQWVPYDDLDRWMKVQPAGTTSFYYWPKRNFP